MSENKPGKAFPETIENDWNRFYRDFPEVYDRFGRVRKQPTAVEVINQHFPLAGKTVVDVGSGTGLSTFELAEYAREVIGVEPEAAMRAVAEQEAKRLYPAQAGTPEPPRVRFIEGWAEALPLEDQSVDRVVAITLASLYQEENIRAFAREGERVARPGGVVLTVDLASGWYGGELAEIIEGRPREQMETNLRDRLLPTLGYRCIEFFADQDYGTVENAVQTYGFIFGKKAIDFLRREQKAVIRWKLNMHYKQV